MPTWFSPVNVRRRITDMLLLNNTLCVPISAENTAYATGKIAYQKPRGPFLLQAHS